MTESVQYIDGDDRVILIGTGVRFKIPAGARVIDAGGYDLQFARWAADQWIAKNDGDLQIKITTIPIPKVEEDIYPLIDVDLDEDGCLPKDWENDMDLAAAMWPSMSSRRINKVEVTIDGVAQPWGSFFEVMGLGFKPGNKGFKRLGETISPRQIWYTGHLGIFALTAEDRAERGLNDVALDGVFGIRKSVARKAIMNVSDPAARFGLMRKLNSARITRWSTGRFVSHFGFGKGFMIVIPDRTMDRLWGTECDIITDDSNIKSELWLTDETSESYLTFEPLKDQGEVKLDYQTRAWTKNWLEDISTVKATIDARFQKTLEDLKAGNLPTWLYYQDVFYRNGFNRHDPLGNERKPKEWEIMTNTWYRASAAGFPITASATIISLMARGVINTVNSTIQAPYPTRENPLGLPNNSDPTAKGAKIWAPASWACYGYVITHEALAVLAGYEVPGDPDVLRWDPLTKSLVMSAQYLEDNYLNHGGPDLDDRFCIYLRWDGRDLVGVLIRQPNCSGEYSMVKINPFHFPWKNTYGPIPTLDNTWKVPQVTERHTWQILFETMNPAMAKTPMPCDTWSWGETYTTADAIEAMQVATINIGVGPYMNARMVCDDLNLHLDWHCGPEDVIDNCQGSPSRAFCEWNNTHTQNIWSIIAGLDETHRVDLLLYSTKISEKRRKNLRTRKGQFYQIWTHARDSLAAFEKEARTLGFKLRAKNKPEIFRYIDFSEDVKRWATGCLEWWENTALPIIKEEVRINNLSKEVQPSPYREWNGRLADFMLDFFTTDGVVDTNNLHQTVLCMYDMVTKPRGPEMPYGIGDEMLFGPPPAHKVGMFDIAMDAFTSIGIADQVYILKSGRNSTAQFHDRFTIDQSPREEGEHYSLYIGEISAQAAEDIFDEWATSANDTEAMEIIRLLGTRGSIQSQNTDLVDDFCDYLEDGDY